MTAEAFLGVERSLLGRYWRARGGDDREGLAIAQRLALPEIVGRLLAARGVGAEAAERGERRVAGPAEDEPLASHRGARGGLLADAREQALADQGRLAVADQGDVEDGAGVERREERGAFGRGERVHGAERQSIPPARRASSANALGGTRLAIGGDGGSR